MRKSIGQWTAEIREINIEKGWRPGGGGPGDNTWGDYVSLLHSEISEALEAFRDHGLADATRPACGNEGHTGNPCPEHGMGKPEGVGSELADVFIRLVDMCDVFGIKVFDMDMEIGDVSNVSVSYDVRTFGDHLAELHEAVSELWVTRRWPPNAAYSPAVLRMLVTVARKFGIDLEAEVARKVAFNRTRTFQHGGRTMAPKMAAVPERSAMDWVRGSIPDDPRDWWTSDEAGDLIGTWGNAGLPQVKVADATGEVLTLWVADLKAAAEKLGVVIYDAAMGIEIKQGAYVVNVVQAK